MKTINSINTISLHYARLTDFPYGSRGEQRDFLVDTEFEKTLKAAFKETFENCSFGIPEIVTTAGIFVNKPGQHGNGRAFDLDAIFWQNHSLITLNFVHQKELYLGIESFFRKHFGLVLNHFYPNHKDHWHLDNSVPVDYNEYSNSETLYVQLVLKHIYKKEVLIDGIWGRQTRGFVKEVFDRLGINTPITTKKNYLKFLDLTGKIAFKLSEEYVTPPQLIDNLVDIIEDLPLQNRNLVQEALNSFIDHDETLKWLNTFNDKSKLDSIIDNVIV
jgi:hypothetical protein